MFKFQHRCLCSLSKEFGFQISLPKVLFFVSYHWLWDIDPNKETRQVTQCSGCKLLGPKGLSDCMMSDLCCTYIPRKKFPATYLSLAIDISKTLFWISWWIHSILHIFYVVFSPSALAKHKSIKNHEKVGRSNETSAQRGYCQNAIKRQTSLQLNNGSSSTHRGKTSSPSTPRLNTTVVQRSGSFQGDDQKNMARLVDGSEVRRKKHQLIW